MRLFNIIRRDLNDTRPIFGSSNEPPVDRSILDYPTALVSAPFEILGAVFRGSASRTEAYQEEAEHSPQSVAHAPSPPEPTIAELRAKLDRDLRDADLLPVSPEEKTEIKAQIELRFLKRMEQFVDGTV